MLSDDTGGKIIGRLEGPKPDTSVLTVVAFVEKQLVEFSVQYTSSAITNEKGLTQELCVLLNFYVKEEGYPFWFEKEYMEEPEKGDSPQVDIGVISSQERGIVIGSKCFSRESFFSMEAKRLDKISKTREKEYLVGRIEKGKYKECGGVERFKKEIHGKGLRYGAIIGYVQAFDFDYWHNTINSWIDELIDGMIDTSVKWSEKDKLLEEYKYSTTARFKSENSRIADCILLIHLWVSLIPRRGLPIGPNQI